MTQITSLAREDFRAFDTDLIGWINKQGNTHELMYLLAHADDGVIWGRYCFQSDRLLTSGQAFTEVAVDLSAVTLQQMRLFGPKGEILIWQTDEGFDGRYLVDSPDDDVIEETHLLWGAAASESQKGFTLMRDGRQGLLHAPPIILCDGQRAGVKVRHYIQHDEQGQAYIPFSRLVDLVEVKENRNDS